MSPPAAAADVVSAAQKVRIIAPRVDPAPLPALDELNEVRELVRALNRFIYHYQVTQRGSAHGPLVEKAAKRAEEALIECMRKATDELMPI